MAESVTEMTEDDVRAHGVAIARAFFGGETEFIAAFAAYVNEVVERETAPYQKVASFVWGMLEGIAERRGLDGRTVCH